jgi:hypothetical protein
MTTLLVSPARIAADPAVLGTIADPDCSLAVWQRPGFADFTPLTAGSPDDLRFTSTPDALAADLARALAEAGFGGGPALHAALVEDAVQLAHGFCAAMDLARFELRLEVVRTDSCRKFHADYVTARLITTYVGEGTDWLDTADAARVAAGDAPRRINRLAPFDVGVFKGKLASDTPAIHRSPPIAGSPGGVRLLMVLNPVSRRLIDGEDCPLPSPPHLA